MNFFSTETYTNRRSQLIDNVKGGLILIMGNEEAPMNYKDNTYRYRQDSNFLYYFGINQAGLAATIDTESGETTIYGQELSIDDIIWIGPHPTLKDLGEKVGVSNLKPVSSLAEKIQQIRSQNRKIHYTPPYRYDNVIKMSSLFAQHHTEVLANVSKELIIAIVNQRSYKTNEELIEMSEAVNITRQMHIAAMKYTKPEMLESDVVGMILHEAKRFGSDLSYPAIFSINGQTLHNHYHGNVMHSGNLALNDSGAENKMGYAGDITRTFPVNGKFTAKQKEIYEIVLDMEVSCISALKPGVMYRDIHIMSNTIMLTKFKELGLVMGDVDEMVAAGVGGLFMPHGLGHMIGLDVHDMEDLGEQYVGYSQGLERSTQLGLKSLRLARNLEEGFVITVEPGIYFIPELISKWKGESKLSEYINYHKLEDYLDFGGVRIEDDVVITSDGHQVLGERIPKSVAEVEDAMAR